MYMAEVVAKQQADEGRLRKRQRAPRVQAQMAAPAGTVRQALARVAPDIVQAPEQQARSEPKPFGGERRGGAVDYRITGFWRWRTVVVPPNVYVVHTRRGRDRPLNIGLGTSFRYDPYIDSFLCIPAAMQTIFINAQSICIERQGILIQAYVQWIIGDIEVAYRRLDFSDPDDPMGVVNMQLRVQAEAAIKDKVATLGIDEVLSDKQPIIEELTTRLRKVAEGGADGEGLGLKIVTVQLQEAVVSSPRVWQNLQRPFRAERAKLAQLAELRHRREIETVELENRRAQETERIETERALAKIREAEARERYDREQAEAVRRHELEQAQEQRAITERNATEVVRREAALALALKELEIEQRRVDLEIAGVEAQARLEAAQAVRALAEATAQVELAALRHRGEAERRGRELELERLKQEIENALSDQRVQSRLIEKLPEIAAAMPAPAELRSVQIGGGEGGLASLIGLLHGVAAAVDQVRGEGGAQG